MHELTLEHQEGTPYWTARCTCGWTSTYHIDDVPEGISGDLQTLATAELRLRFEQHLVQQTPRP